MARMYKRILFLSMLLTGAAASAGQPAAAIQGPHAARCAPGAGPALLVTVAGLKDRGGQIRLRLYGGATSTWFAKGKYLLRTQIPTPKTGAVRICMPVPAPGVYALDLRHDVNGNGDTEKSDGGGASGDPHMTLFGILLGRKPSPKQVGVTVGNGVTPITITTMYLSGGSFKAIG